MSRDETVLCLSHLRWNFVYQRPQHLLSRCARSRRVVYFEEPIFDARAPSLALDRDSSGVVVAVPHLPPGLSEADSDAAQRKMIDEIGESHLGGTRPVLWYYTPMALSFTDHVRARAVVYDCMDELALFQGAPASLTQREKRLFGLADVVFTGGYSLYEHKRQTTAHRNVHPFPSSVDAGHFGQARGGLDEPRDQSMIARPRVGFAGVIDERMDLELVAAFADLRPELQLVMVGPVVKIDPASLPRRPNIHWLGGKPYDELPAYLGGWDVAMMPFARNESTRFISPTKTPEYLAAGLPVVSTSITDVVSPYGRAGLASIADTAPEFAAAVDDALASERTARIAHADAYLADLSWDRTWQAMWEEVKETFGQRSSRTSGIHPVLRPLELVDSVESLPLASSEE